VLIAFNPDKKLIFPSTMHSILTRSMNLLFIALSCLLAFNTFAQELATPFHVQLFPFTDVHMHASLKPFNSRNVAKYNMWEQIDHNCDGRISNLFLNGSKEVPKTSQAHLEGLIKGNVKLAYLSLTPLEKEMMDAKLLNEQKKGLSTMACVSGVENCRVVGKGELINYYDDFVENIRYVQEGENIPYYLAGKAYSYEVAKNGKHLQELMQDPTKIALVLNIEGGHTLGHSLDPLDVSNTEAYHKFYLENVDRLKGILPIKEGSTDYLDYPVLAINLNHFFWNGLCGQARTFSGLQTFIFGAGKGVDEGMTPLGEKAVAALLDKSKGRRVLVDIKHMSLASRQWYYGYLKKLREQGDTVAVFSSHSTAAGLSMTDKAYLEKDNKAKNKNSYLNRWTISLSAEDIREIHLSKGLIGIMLDKYKLIGGLSEKLIEETVPGSIQRRRLYAKIVWANVFTCIHAVGEKSAWDIVSVGSDFDGMIVPFETYPRANEMIDLANDLLYFLKNPEPIFDIFSKEDIEKLMYGLSAEEIMQKFMYQNGLDFAIRNLNSNSSTKIDK
jgi:microsomal dipeptidase-like Zn-dependent dipeptidase